MDSGREFRKMEDSIKMKENEKSFLFKRGKSSKAKKAENIIDNCKITFPRPLRVRGKLAILEAFTVAEVIIAIVVIGVIAAFVVPSFIHQQDIKVNAQREDNIVYKLKQATDMMKVNGELDKFSSTDEFVDVLQKYIKINKRCSSSNIEECWPTKTITKVTGETFEIKNAKTRSALGFDDEYGNNPNVGLVLADGSHLILTYNPGFEGLPSGDMEHDSMEGLSFVVDVNGSRGPNKESSNNKYYDIHNISLDDKQIGAYDIRGYNKATLSQCSGYFEGTTCHDSTDDCVSGYVENKQCKMDIDSCSGYINEDRLCINNVNNCNGFLNDDKTCNENLTNCSGYVDPNSKQCKETSTCKGYVEDKECKVASECENQGGHVANYNCVFCDASNCATGYCDSNGVCQSNVATCSGYIDSTDRTCKAASECTGMIYDKTCTPKYTGSGQTGCDSVGGQYIQSANLCFKNLGTNYSQVNCQAGSGADYNSYCNGSKDYTNDYWEGAKKACAQIGMTLPAVGVAESGQTTTGNNLNGYCNSYNSTLGISSGTFWSSSYYHSETRIAWFVYFDDCTSNYADTRTNVVSALCVR